MSRPSDSIEQSGSSGSSTFAFTKEHLDFVQQYHSGCDECEDVHLAGGVCPRTGMKCGDRTQATKFVFEAIEYGVKHGFILSPVNTLNDSDDRAPTREV